MNLTKAQIDYFTSNGFLFVESAFSPKEMDVALTEMQGVIREDCPRRILEQNGSVRSFFAPHFSNRVFDVLSRDERVVRPSAQLLGTDIYLYQAKLNTKSAMCGDWWEWHQDYVYWKQDDGMPEPAVLTVMIFLNDTTEFNGPLLLIPGSHHVGVVDNEAHTVVTSDPLYNSYLNGAAYLTSLTADMKYKLKQETIRIWAEKAGIVAAKGPSGSLLFFHGNIFHASSNNLSPWDRHSYLLTYNSVENKPPVMENPRPDFLVNRKAEPITTARFSADIASFATADFA